jgi:uncharacterized protein
MSDGFWKQKKLQEMSEQEWEQLCDGCARCCLLKLEDADTGELYFTNVSCHLLNINKCSCNNYQNRKFLVPECLLVRNMALSEYQWLPETCAYRLLSEGRALPHWHPLLSGNKKSVRQAGATVSAFAMSEEHIHPDQLGEHIINLPITD